MTAALALTKSTLDVGIVPHDVDAMQRFYSEVLALPAAPPRAVQRATLISHTVGTSALKLLCVDSPPPREEGGIDAAATLLDKGVQMPLPPMDVGTGWLCIYADPDGNWTEVLEPKQT